MKIKVIYLSLLMFIGLGFSVLFVGSVFAGQHANPDEPAVPVGCPGNPGTPTTREWCQDGGYVTPETGYVSPADQPAGVDPNAPAVPVGCPGNPGDATTNAWCPDGSYVNTAGNGSTERLEGARDWGLPVVPADASLIERLLGTVFFFTGALATIFIIVGGLRYVLSIGNPEAIQKAKNTIVYALVGLVVSVFAYAIVNFIISSL